MGLVDYDSDSNSDEPRDTPPSKGGNGNRTGPVPTRKRRKLLPSLPTAFATTDHVDDPTLHQGRSRSRPFVSGEYNAHLYIDLELPSALDDLLQEVTDLTMSLCPGYDMHSLLRSPVTPSEGGEATGDKISARKLPLHISLTHPLPLRRDQLKSFKADVTARIREYRGNARDPLKLSLAKDITAYVNGRRYGGEGSGGRAFLAVRVAAGTTKLEDMIDKAIHPLLDNLHLPRYHSNPEFHASFAWCLLIPSSTSRSTSTEVDDLDLSDLPSSGEPDDLPTPFTPALLEKLNKEFADRLLRAQPPGGWDVMHLDLKIAKDIHHIAL